MAYTILYFPIFKMCVLVLVKIIAREEGAMLFDINKTKYGVV